MPASLAASLRLARLRDAPDAYRAQPIAPGAWRALNARQSFVTTFASSGVEVALHQREPARASLRLASVGCPGHQEPAADAPPERDGGEVRFRRGAVTEWYLHGEDGLEQGVSLAHEPCPGADRTRLEIAVEGELRPRSTGDGEVELVASAGAASLRYGKLWAVDAKGRELPAQMRIEEGRIAIEVETRGAAWPVVVDPLVWTQEARLQRGDGKLTDYFAHSLSLDGDTALVGDTGEGPQGNLGGSAFVFVRASGGWGQQAQLTPAGETTHDSFGQSLALHGDTALVGAPFDSSQGPHSGAAYVFVRQDSVWTQQAKLMAKDVAAGAQLGTSVALSGDTAVVGAWLDGSGSAHVFTRSGASWSRQAKLSPAGPGSDPTEFGVSVSVDGDTALIGAPLNNGPEGTAGSAYVFIRSSNSWSLQARLMALKPSYYDMFGASVSLDGDTALVGATDDSQEGDRFGSAHVFTRTGSTWSQQARLTASDPSALSHFGYRVALRDQTALVGSAHLIGEAPGSAYVFTRIGESWTQSKLLVTDGDKLSKGGVVVALGDNRALVGPAFDPVIQQLAAYVFETRLTPGSPCSADAPPCEVACVDGVCCDAPCDGPCEACSAQGHCQPTATGIPCGAASCASDVQTSMACDGAGTCASLVSTCAPFHCDDASQACLTSCSVDVDCQPGLQCEEQQCVPASQGAGGGGGSAGGDNGGAGPGGLGAGGSGAGGLGSAGSGAGDPGGGSGGSGGSAGQGPGGQTNAGTAGVSASGATGTGGSGGHSGDAGHAGSAVAAAGTAGSGGQGGAGQSGAGQAGAGQSGAGKGGAGQAGTDGGPQLVGVISAEGGCSCRATGGRSTGGSALGLLALGLLAVRRRRAG